jgi:ABC-type multidrug transport system ATPase subunit
MIRTEELVKRYGDFVAVDRVNLNIPAGEIYGFLGPNGSGKTSTIMMLLGIIPATSGRVYLFDEVYTPKRLDLRKRIGMVPEKHPQGMWSWMTGAEYLRFFAKLFGLTNIEPRIDRMLAQVGLSEVKHKKISEFSRGMLQKLSIIRALLHEPDILFLDEPISGLDPIGIMQVRDLILAENREGRTIFISSHMLSEMEKICHRVAVIFRGRLMAEDKMSALLASLAKDREIHVELEYIPEKLQEQIREMPFVIDIQKREQTLIIKVPKDADYRKDISSRLIQQKLVPLRIEEKSLSLEEAFITITKENIDLFTEIRGNA